MRSEDWVDSIPQRLNHLDKGGHGRKSVGSRLNDFREPGCIEGSGRLGSCARRFGSQRRRHKRSGRLEDTRSDRAVLPGDEPTRRSCEVAVCLQLPRVDMRSMSRVDSTHLHYN